MRRTAVNRIKWGRVTGGLLVVALASASFLVVLAPAAHAAVNGAEADKDCPPATPPAFYTLGSVVQCTAHFENTGTLPGTITSLTEQAPFVGLNDPGNGPVTNITCVANGNTLGANDQLPPATLCAATITVTIPNDRAFCNNIFRDRVQIVLSYPQTEPPLEADAAATNTLLVVCPPHITVTKTANPLSKPTDDVTYHITVCNTGLIDVNNPSVTDTLLGDISSHFPATIAAPPVGQTQNCAPTVTLTRTVLGSDPNPLVNTVTVTYTGVGTIPVRTDTQTATASTDLFFPGVGVTKSCSPSPIEVGQDEHCHIVITNTSTGTTPPPLLVDSINDTLKGDLTGSAGCGSLATGASCSINTSRTVLDTDPTPLSNTVTVHYHPQGFTNDITNHASASVTILVPSITFTVLGPVCVQDHPFIRWVITPHNVTDATTATITITDIHGNVVKKLTDQPLTGETLWPGATINPDDWPGWKLVNGVWVEDPTDAVLREGVTVTAEVNPSASGFVAYPPATSACANPPTPPPPPPKTPPPPLPFTGSGAGPALIGLIILLAGAALVARTRRRHRAVT
jgi:uncharacterized repeat protein (TIGR01451 family)